MFVTRRIPGSEVARLSKYAKVVVNPRDGIISRKDLIAGVEADALLCLLTDKIDKLSTQTPSSRL